MRTTIDFSRGIYYNAVNKYAACGKKIKWMILCTVDGTSVSNIKVQGNSSNSIDVSGGIGAINLKFKESEAK